MSSTEDASIGWQQRLPTLSLQAQFFHLKFPELGKEKINEMRDVFMKFDGRKVGELQEDEALRLLEYRGETKRVVELRQMVQEMDYDHNREISFLEWSCAYFGKSWKVLHEAAVNQEDIDKALQKFRDASQKEIQAAEIARAKAEEVRKAELKGVELEERNKSLEEKNRELEEQKLLVAERENQRKEELKRKEEEEKRKREEATSQQGVKGMAAKFHYKSADTKDTTKENQLKINRELEAKKKKKEEEKVIEEEKKRTDEEKQLTEEHAKKNEEERERAEEEKRIAEEEKQQAELEKAKAEEERKKAEEGSADYLKLKQEEMKRKEEEDKRLAEEKEKERKAKVQAKLKEKFTTKN